MIVTMLKEGRIATAPTIVKIYPAGWCGAVPDAVAKDWIKDRTAAAPAARAVPAGDQTPPPPPPAAGQTPTSAPAPVPRTRATATPPAV